MSTVAPRETEVRALAHAIVDAGTDERPRVFHLGWLSDVVLDGAMASPSFKTRLFRFVDVFPACRDDAEVMRHLEEYFADVAVPRALELGLGVVEHLPFGAQISAAAARHNIRRIARQFIADEAKDLTLELLRLIGAEFSDGPPLGAVIQAYRTDAYADLQSLVAWARRTLAQPLHVRLVKGAYWELETSTARLEGWSLPVFDSKAATDANYERCVRYLVGESNVVRAAFASHNVRSLAYAIASARAAGLADDAFELQLLYGMAEPVHAALCRLGFRVRVYAPVGELVPGMAYLVRRLLENTSNESFIRQRFAEARALATLLAPPAIADDALAAAAGMERPVSPTLAAAPTPFVNEPRAELRRPRPRAHLLAAVSNAPGGFPLRVPVLIGGERIVTGATYVSVDPGRTTTVVAESATAGPGEVASAVEIAERAFPAWKATPWEARAEVLFRAAARMRERRAALAALEVFEAGKPIPEADADVCEAIDFAEYYGRAALALAAGRPLPQLPGESNRYRYQPRGIGAVIAPWNFPLAIPLGMIAAALVTGNCVLFKPAEQTPAIALRLVEILLAAGVPSGVLALLPGDAETGAALVAHPKVAFVAFTGSKATGLAIIERAAVTAPDQRQVKHVVAEMGGKNAIIVDSDADLDQAVPAIVASVFAYAGQKCSAASRVIAVRPVYEQLVERIVGATALVPVGHPRELATVIGPLIDAEACARVRRYQALARAEGEVLLDRDDVLADGWYVGPSVVALENGASRVATEEIFGPVLAVFRADDFDAALTLANATEYALTGGFFSRSPAHIRRATDELRAGNLYVNRAITGARVGREPFGGYGMSGIGSKAGGPDYLLQFVEPRVVTENTIRQGFVAIDA